MKCYLVCLATFLSSFVAFWITTHPSEVSSAYIPQFPVTFDYICLASLSLAAICIHYHSVSFRIDVIIISAFLGCWLSFAAKSVLLQSHPSLTPLYVYIGLMCSFHFLEFLLTSIFHPFSLSLDSFLLNQSHQYIAAFCLSLTEFSLELYFMPSLKHSTRYLFWSGLCIAVLGDIIRKGAMIQAGVSFTHIVQSYKRANHKLVTNGLYGFVRHPTYTGWTMFAVGSQLMLRDVAIACVIF